MGSHPSLDPTLFSNLDLDGNRWPWGPWRSVTAPFGDVLPFECSATPQTPRMPFLYLFIW